MRRRFSPLRFSTSAPIRSARPSAIWPKPAFRCGSIRSVDSKGASERFRLKGNRSNYLFCRIFQRKTVSHLCWKCSKKIP
ncbi:hypothetical protein DYJ20_08975 [Brucella melitensis]|nr:hypothetical protein EAI02_10130 [Brucella abortus]MUJ31298.1 hypothetical protein [Brucella abortus]RFZ73650.1 hypothetical protein DYJ20_08975 [Brucella melitensis]